MKHKILFAILDTSACLRWALLTSLCITLLACGSEPEQTTEPLPRVKAEPLAKVAIAYEYSASARAISLSDSALSAELTAPVIATPADVGRSVEAGEVLLELDCDNAKNQLQAAQSSLSSLQAREKLATQQYQRAKRLRTQGGISEEDLNLRQSERSVASAERQSQTARVAIAQRDVNHCTIKAPFKGVITERHVQIGEIASAGMAVLRIVDTENLEVAADIVTEDADSLKQAKQPHFIYGRKHYPLTLRAIAGAVDSRTRTQEARLCFSNEQPLPGISGRLVWKDTRMALPAHLLSQRQQQLGILVSIQVAENAQVKFIPLADAQAGQPAFVDWPADTLIITDGRLGLSPGDAINIIPAP